MREEWDGTFNPDQTLNFNRVNRRFRLILPVPGFVYFKTWSVFFFPSIFYCFLRNILIVVAVFLY